jgi:hypothetical protein
MNKESVQGFSGLDRKEGVVMETLVHLSWRLYLALPLMALGAACAVWGAKRGLPGLLRAVRGNATQLVPLMEGFRATIIGLALVGISVAWIWHLPWLFAISLAVGGGETMETSLILFALRHGADLKIGLPISPHYHPQDEHACCRQPDPLELTAQDLHASPGEKSAHANR